VPLRRASIPGLFYALAFAWTSTAAAQGPDPTRADPEPIAAAWPSPWVEDDKPASSRTTIEHRAPLPGKYRFLAGMGVGRGLRFQNPYRLQTELGRDAESLSLTATYLDLALGALFGSGGPTFHGALVSADFALDGITQEVLTPSYLFFRRLDPRWAVLGRAGVPIVIEPDVNAGFELGGGGVFYLTAGLGVTASLVGSLFFGAATLESSRPAIPVLSMELGVVYDYEVLP